jgi:hypothetical protein
VSRAILLFATIVLAALLFPCTVSAQAGANGPNGDPPKRSLNGDGSEFFRALLHIRGVKPVKEREFPIRDYEDVIVIVLGDPNPMPNRMAPLQRHINPIPPPRIVLQEARRGGAILIASSNNVDLHSTIPNFSMITGVQVQSDGPNSILAGRYNDCPFAVPVPRPLVFHDPQSAVRRLFDGDLGKTNKLDRVVAGTPSFILLKDEKGITGLAGFPRRTFEMPNANNAKRRIVPENAFFAVGGDLEEENTGRPYRFLAMASNRVFNNALMYRAVSDQPDDRTDNLEMCIRTIDYLQGPNRERKRCIFFENGQLIEHFDDLARATSTQNMPMPRPNLDSLQKQVVDMANRELDRIQTNDDPNKWINNQLGLPKIMVWALWAAGLSALLFMIQRLFGSGKPNDPQAPKILPASSQPPGVFERRQKELLRRNNVYEPVRDLIRDFFHSVGIEGEPGPKIPRLQISESVRKPDSLRIAIKDLWRLAFGAPQVVNVSFWRELEPYFRRVCEAHNQGKWAFAFESWDMG